jgi:hypothetical protein
MTRALLLGVALVVGAWSVGCGARSGLDQEPQPNAAQGGAVAGAIHGGATQGGATQGGATQGGATQGGATATSSGGVGGSAGVGAQAGAGGAPPCSPLIDNMENGSGRILPCPGRVGDWYVYNDGFGVEYPAVTPSGVPILPTLIPGGRGASKRAMYASYSFPGPPISTNPSVNWGAGIGVDLSFDGEHYGLYDASAYDGISFWARGTYRNILVRISTAATTLVGYGGTCPAEFCAPAQSGKTVFPDWQQYSVAFADLTQPYHAPMGPAFPKDQLTNIQFLFTLMDLKTEFWIDDLTFYVDRVK